MDSTTYNIKTGKWVAVIAGLGLAISFFLPWISWLGNSISGQDMALGKFFSTSEDVFGIGNPFPQFNFTLIIFWGIPLGVLATVVLLLLNKKPGLLPFITGSFSLALFTVYYLYTKENLPDANVPGLVKWAGWVHAAMAIAFIFSVTGASLLKKGIWLLIGPVLAYGMFNYGKKFAMGETHAATENVKADYAVSAGDLLKEFILNDTAANKKYIEKMLEVNGKITELKILDDSTSTINFADSTGSYAIFSLEKDQFAKINKFKQGDSIFMKGVCSGSIFSDILGTTSITFKRATININKLNKN